MSKLGTVKAQGSASITGILLLAIVTAILGAIVTLVKLSI
jgi:hypothetical protein